MSNQDNLIKKAQDPALSMVIEAGDKLIKFRESIRIVEYTDEVDFVTDTKENTVAKNTMQKGVVVSKGKIQEQLLSILN